MAHDIIDNRSIKLIDELAKRFPHSDKAKFAVGYFFLSGLESLREHLYNLQELRLLIGNTTNRATIEQISEGYRRLEPVREAIESETYIKRSDVPAFVNSTIDNLRESVALMDQTDAGVELVSSLVRLISEQRLKIRIYTKGRLHAKAYIFDYAQAYDAAGRALPQADAGVAIVGSSNFTLSGISHNTELNVVVHGNDNHQQLTAWFEELWAESSDFDRALMDELQQSWALAQPTPYDIYMKTLYTLVQNRAIQAHQTTFLWNDDINDQLADFQRVAVVQAIQMIGLYGGCFVSDVVGLGKSFIGAAIVKHFERVERARPLIICPKPLLSMWQRYNQVYQLHAEILPMSMLRFETEDQNPLLTDVRYRDRDFVLIDESHNFRNPDSQRYRILQQYLDGGRRCALLTATPRNSDVWDVYHQIRLFHSGDITSIPIDPPQLKHYFESIEAGRKSLPELLTHILVRRTRSHIVRWYGYDLETDQRIDPEQIQLYRSNQRRAYVHVGGRKQSFPQRELKTLEYSIEATYQGLYEQLRNAMGRRAEQQTMLGDQHILRYARYSIWDYIKKGKEKHYRELRNASVNLRGLIRTMLFKRFESSVYAFRTTLRRMLKTHQAFLLALENNLIPAGNEAISLLNQHDEYDDNGLIDALQQLTKQYPAADFNIKALKNDISHDIATLEYLLNVVEPITAEQDAKLQQLKQLLTEQYTERKGLIFTQYADTARYLYEHLKQSSQAIEVIYSNNRDKAKIVARFSPNSNQEIALGTNDSPIQILIATDVLSEGLNLQDCDSVINYDLHWNPVRLIQRFGRIDRIGSTNQQIYGINFLPELELERHLALSEKLRQRIREIHDTIGEDAAILEPGERLNERAMYAIYTGQSTDELEDPDDGMIGLNEAEEILRQLQTDQPDEYQRIINLRDGIRSGRWSSEQGRIIVCQAGRYLQLIQTDREGHMITRDIPTILKLLRCEPAETRIEPDPLHNQVVNQTYHGFVREVQQRRAEQLHAPKLTAAQRYIQQELQRCYNLNEHDDLRQQIAVLDKTFRGTLTNSIHAELTAIKRASLYGDVLIQELATLYTRYNLDQPRAGLQDSDADPAKIVCSIVLA